MGPIFNISKLAASFEALSHLRAIKTGDSWAWCTPFGAQTWFFTEMQGNMVHQAHEFPVLMALR